MPKYSLSSTRTLVLGVCLVSAVLAASACLAHDLGVQAKVFTIIEVDIREMLMRSVASQNWDDVNKKMKESAENYVKTLPKREAGEVAKTTTTYIDPTYVLPDDLYAPVKNASGDYEYRLMYAKGTRVNPMDYQRPYTAMLYFDAKSPAQLAFVEEALKRHPGRLMPVELTGENPVPLADKWHTPVFSANAAMLKRFPVTASPSLLYAGDTPHRKELAVTTFAAPFSQTELDNTWPEGLRGPGGSVR